MLVSWEIRILNSFITAITAFLLSMTDRTLASRSPEHDPMSILVALCLQPMRGTGAINPICLISQEQDIALKRQRNLNTSRRAGN